jgi:hypothetical protein
LVRYLGDSNESVKNKDRAKLKYKIIIYYIIMYKTNKRKMMTIKKDRQTKKVEIRNLALLVDLPINRA